MKSVYEIGKMSAVMEEFGAMHEALSFARSRLKSLENLLFTLEGELFGELTVIDKHESDIKLVGSYKAAWNCRCSCGKFKVVSHNDLLKNEVTDCGCKSKSKED